MTIAEACANLVTERTPADTNPRTVAHHAKQAASCKNHICGMARVSRGRTYSPSRVKAEARVRTNSFRDGKSHRSGAKNRNRETSAGTAKNDLRTKYWAVLPGSTAKDKYSPSYVVPYLRGE